MENKKNLSKLKRKEILKELKNKSENKDEFDSIFLDKLKKNLFKGYEYSNFSLIDDNDYFRPKIQDYIHGKEKLTLIESRSLGCFYGMMCGDSFGSFFEFMPVRGDKEILNTKDKIIDIDDIPKLYKYSGNIEDFQGGNFGLKLGQWTDDSSMGLCISDSLISNNGKSIYKDCTKIYFIIVVCRYE